MEPVFASVARWAVPLWCASVLAALAWLGWTRKWAGWRVKLLGVCALVAAYPLLDVRIAPPRPTQVVYRFDDHRYLELTGFGCEGALYYVDPKLQIRTEAAAQFYRLFLKPYIHPSTRYIAIPDEDGGSFIVSSDGGRTFRDARYATEYKVGGRDGGGQTQPVYDDIDHVVVVNDQGFVALKDGRLFMSSKPLDNGEKWGHGYVDAIGLKNSTLAELPEFQNLPTQIPEIKNYTGWTRMQCDPDFGTTPPFNPFAYVQQKVFDLEAWTLGAPVYFGLRALAQ
ncbi:hypothetical protein [Ralstonia sp. 1138]|uniref:T6SS immunity protein Tli3 family protein n=1 Tax=Ralstonia sp. 1138 TaxID=3156423 RepID=UPI0033928BCD